MQTRKARRMRKLTCEYLNRVRISRSFALWGSCCVLFTGGCQANVGDFFTYAPKSHIITQDWMEETLADGGGSGSGNPTAETGSGTERPASQVSQTTVPVTQTPESQSSEGQASEEGLVGNVEYIGIGERGIIRDIPFVYKGLQFSYDGEAEDFSMTERSSGRPVESTIARSTEAPAESEERPLRYGIVDFNKTFYEGRLEFRGDFQADIIIAYSGAGKLQPGNGVPVEVPVPVVYEDDDDDDDWRPATVVIQLCGAVGGKNGRTYGVVRNQDGSLDMMQYSYEYTDSSGTRQYVRLIASFYGGSTEEQAVGLLDRFNFKYVGENME